MRNLKINILIILLTIAILSPKISFADGGLVAYYKVTILKTNIKDATELVKQVLTANNDIQGNKVQPFIILGEYNPTSSKKMYVITFTRSDLLELTYKIGDKTILASVLKIGIQELKNSEGGPTGEVMISLLNPDYLFYAYIRNKITSENESALFSISEDIKFALYNLPNAVFVPLVTSSLTENELKNFRFMVRYPSFDDDISLYEFTDFNIGVATIINNLRARKTGTFNVYAIVPKDFEKLADERLGEIQRILPEGSQQAVFGVGLLDKRIGEGKFLPILGEEHISALPYEILLENTKASMLNGRFRFPLFWSDVSIQELSQIYKTPRDIEETFKSLMK